MGANDQEDDGAFSRKEFVHRYGIVRKEGKETSYWLRIIGANERAKTKEAEKLSNECNEIVAIVSKIISNSNRRSVKRSDS